MKNSLRPYVIVIAWLFILYALYSTRGGVEKLHTARGAAECCMQLRDPNPSAVLRVQYKNNHAIGNLLYFAFAPALALALGHAVIRIKVSACARCTV